MSHEIIPFEQIRRTNPAGDAAQVEALEAEIDTHVFRLYGLTPQEIAMIQSPVPK